MSTVIPDYGSELEEYLCKMLALHSTEDLKRLHILLAPKLPPFDKHTGDMAVHALYHWKDSLAGKVSQIIEDILAVRQDKGVVAI